mgnify:CR=1 FL=1
MRFCDTASPGQGSVPLRFYVILYLTCLAALLEYPVPIARLRRCCSSCLVVVSRTRLALNVRVANVASCPLCRNPLPQGVPNLLPAPRHPLRMPLNRCQAFLLILLLAFVSLKPNLKVLPFGMVIWRLKTKV